MFGWINVAQTAREDRDRPGLDCRLMRACIDPACEAGNDVLPGVEGKSRRPARVP
jgi:hypothetical protein